MMELSSLGKKTLYEVLTSETPNTSLQEQPGEITPLNLLKIETVPYHFREEL